MAKEKIVVTIAGAKFVYYGMESHNPERFLNNIDSDQQKLCALLATDFFSL